MVPFDYPDRPHVRRHGPRGYQQPASFRPWLRDDFSFRCVFCLRREQWDRASSLEVEHFLPSGRFPNQRLNYHNLFYACSRCNSAKGDRAIDDPSRTLLSGNVVVGEDGRIIGQSDEARRLITALRLNSAEAVHYRRLWIEIVAMARQFAPDLLHTLMQLPDDLPDLSRLKPPDGNSRPDGVVESHHARRNRGELPDTGEVA